MDLPEGLASSGALDIQARLNSISGGRVLDVATGDGDFIHTLMKTLKDYDSFVGIDSSEEELQKAKEAFEGGVVEIFQMNAEDIEFEDCSFDTVCISYSLHHLGDMERVLREMQRVLRSNGHFIVQEDYSDPGQTEAQMNGMLSHHLIADIDTLLGRKQHKTLRKHKIRDAVEILGLRELEILDTSHPVKCLFCERMFDCADPLNEWVVSFALQEVDENLARLEGHQDVETVSRLMREGERLKARFRKSGSASTSQIFLIGVK